MSAARPTHAWALVPFHPDAAGNDHAAEGAVDSWVRAHSNEYTMDAPRLVCELGAWFMYVSGTLLELVYQQSRQALETQVVAQDAANAINEDRRLAEQRKLKVVGAIPEGGGQAQRPRGR